MKVGSGALATALCLGTTAAFAPSAFTRSARSSVGQTGRLAMTFDPSAFHDLPYHVETIRDAFASSVLISDLDTIVDVSQASGAIATSAVENVAVAAGTAVAPAASEAAAAGSGNGWFGFLEGPIENLLQIIHGVFVSVGLPGAWGISIIAMTAFIKLLTYPLTKQQLESTSRMQLLQPQIKELQAKYASNPEVMNKKISEIYQVNEVNPLAGCLPSIVQIPVFIGLYRAVLTLAKDNKLDESFLWLPSLEGPTYGADPTEGSAWILKNWVDGVPSLGWEDTAAFLTIPIFLVISQSVSMQLMAPKNGQEQPAFLKFLPLLIGWFSLNVPAALGIYWVANNLITTALTLQIRSGIPDPVTPDGGGGAAVIDAQATSFTPAPMREKPSGFAEESDFLGVKPITAIDADVIADVSESVTSEDAGYNGPIAPSAKKKRGKKRKKRRS